MFHQVVNRRKIPEQNNDTISDIEAANKAWINHKINNESIIIELFQVSFHLKVKLDELYKLNQIFHGGWFLRKVYIQSHSSHFLVIVKHDHQNY